MRPNSNLSRAAMGACSRALSGASPRAFSGAVLGALALGFASCSTPAPRSSPIDRFYYPTAIGHVDVAGKTEGTLYVASSNADRCYDEGALRAVSLDALPVPLPALGAPVDPAGPVQLTDLGSQDPAVQRSIATFAGQLATWPLPTGGTRLMIPTRSEGGLLHVIDATGPEGTSLACVPATAGANVPENCMDDALRLEVTPSDSESNAIPRAPAPYGVSIAADGQAFVTHMVPADDPLGSQKNLRGYVVRMSAADPQLHTDDFLVTPTGGTQSIAIGQRYAFISARVVGGLDAVMAVPRDRSDRVIFSFPLQEQYSLISTRGLALSADERSLYLVGRSISAVNSGSNPDVLLVASVEGARSAAPRIRVTKVVPLPALPSSIQLVRRSGAADLLLIVSEGAGSLLIYDTGTQQIAIEVLDVGLQPTQLAIDQRTETVGGNSVEQARIYVSNFGDGRIAVVDVPDLTRPEEARVVAHLGSRQDVVMGQQSKTCRIGDE